MKFGEITIIQSKHFYDIFRNMMETIRDDDVIIIKFDDDDSVYDIIMGDKTDKTIHMRSSFDTRYGNNMLYHQKPINKCLNFDNLFIGCNKYNEHKKVTSFINLIYENPNGKEIFGIVKIKSPHNAPRYLLAYDDEYFNKTKVINLVHYMFRNKELDWIDATN